MRSEEATSSLKFLEKLFAGENESHKLSQEKMAPSFKEGMSISATEGAILKFLIQSHNYKKAVEIGCFAAYSSIWIAEGLGDKSSLHTFEYNKEHAVMAQEVIDSYKGECAIKLHQGDAREALKTIEKEAPFDFVFIDANKSAYTQYLEWAYDNIRVGGMIVGDNTLLYGEVGKDKPEKVSNGQWKGMRSFNETLADRSKFKSCFVPTSEGMSIGIKI